jgi:hypothetical protein
VSALRQTLQLGGGRFHEKLPIQREVQLQDVHARLTQKSKSATLGVLCNKSLHFFQRDAAGLGYARRLGLR